MKKYLAVFVLLFSIPFYSFALDRPNGISADDSNVWDALIVLIAQLTRQIDALTIENTALRAVCTQTSSIPQTPQFGTQSLPVSATMPVMTPELVVEINKQDPNSALPLGRYYFTVRYINEEGKSPKGTIITAQFPPDHDANSPYGTEENFTKESTSQHFPPKTNDRGEIVERYYSVQFGPYTPTEAGTKIVTFTSGGVTKTVEVHD